VQESFLKLVGNRALTIHDRRHFFTYASRVMRSVIVDIGRGGMGKVWLATRSDGQLRRNVALKLPILSVRRSVLAQRFERERDILDCLLLSAAPASASLAQRSR